MNCMCSINRFRVGLLLAVLGLACPLGAEPPRKSLLDSDPEVVYLDQVFEKPLELEVVKDAPVYSDRRAQRQLGTLKSGQKLKIEAITDKAYRVRGQGLSGPIVGWVGPWAFSSKDPEFIAQLKQLYDRQMKVKALIEAKELAIGMTLSEVEQVMGRPTKTSLRKTAKGQSGQWEYVEYDEVRQYADRYDPATGMMYRQLVSVTQEEKEKTVVEFEDGYVTALEESKSTQRGAVRIILPQLLCPW